MNRALAALPLALLTTVLVAQDPDPTRQDPPPPDTEEEGQAELRRDIFGRVRPDKAGAGLEGMWQLLAMELEGYPVEGLTPSGYLLIGEGFLAFQMHAYYDEDVLDDEPWEDGYQTFMAEYQLVAGDRLVCTTLIGSYLDEEEDILDYEPVGIEREFTVERKGRLLTLRWGEDDWMTFGRRLTNVAMLKDIYGARRGDRTQRGPDLFGREGVRPPEEERGGEGDPDEGGGD